MAREIHQYEPHVGILLCNLKIKLSGFEKRVKEIREDNEVLDSIVELYISRVGLLDCLLLGLVHSGASSDTGRAKVTRLHIKKVKRLDDFIHKGSVLIMNENTTVFQKLIVNLHHPAVLFNLHSFVKSSWNLNISM